MRSEGRLDHSSLELLVGLALMLSSWLTILLIAIDVLQITDPRLLIAVSIACYVSSVIGLGLSTHGLYTRLIKTKKQKQET